MTVVNSSALDSAAAARVPRGGTSRNSLRLPHRRALAVVDVSTAAVVLGGSAVLPAGRDALPWALAGLACWAWCLMASGAFGQRETRHPRGWISWAGMFSILAVPAMAGAVGWFGLALPWRSVALGTILVFCVAIADLALRQVIRMIEPRVIMVVGNEPGRRLRSRRFTSTRNVLMHIDAEMIRDPERLVAEICERSLLAGAGTIELQTEAGLSGEVVRDLSWNLRLENIVLRLVLTGPLLSNRRIRARVSHGDMYVDVAAPRPGLLDRAGKGVLDAMGSSLLIVALSPVLLLLAALVKFGSRGPVFYRQVRIGLDGKPFHILKFRSMIVDADAHLARLMAEQGRGDMPLFKLENDPRVTGVGSVMRRYSLDELPQLFNVLGGKMSLVGPRPQVADEVALYSGPAEQRLSVRPGMTGMWQVSGRSRLTWERALALDLEYAHNWNVLQDLRILGKTLHAVIGGDGAQ